MRLAPFLEVLARLPVTLELLGAATLLALIIGVALTAAAQASGGVVNRLISGLALALRCIPFFWLAIVSQFFAARYFGESIFGLAFGRDSSLTHSLLRLAVPASVLSLAQLPMVVQALDESDVLKMTLSIRRALWALSLRLPEIFGACFMTEIAFAWRGEGRAFWVAINGDQASLALTIVVLTAIVTLLVRATLAARQDASSSSP